MKYILLIVLIVIAITQAGCSHFNVPNPAICLEITRDKGNCVKILSEEEFEVEDWANFVQTAVVMTKEDFQGVLNLIIDICEEQSCTHHKKIKRKSKLYFRSHRKNWTQG